MKPASNAPFYAAGLYPKLAEVFRAHGYALAVHGSVAKDFDLIAVPWVDSAGDPKTVIADVMEKFAVKYAGSDVADARPHGRLAFKLTLSFADHALDISFTPRVPPETPATPLHRMLFTHWSKDPLIPYAGCECSSCKEARAPISVSISDGTATSAETDSPPITPMNCPHCDGIAPRGMLEHAPGCSAAGARS